MRENLPLRLDLLQTKLLRTRGRKANGIYHQSQFMLNSAKLPEDPEQLKQQISEVKRKLADRKIHHYTKAVQRQIKKTKRIEELKIHKKLKTLNDSDDARQSLLDDVAAIKAVNNESMAIALVQQEVTKLAPELASDYIPSAPHLLDKFAKDNSIARELEQLMELLGQWYGESPKSRKAKKPLDPVPSRAPNEASQSTDSTRRDSQTEPRNSIESGDATSQMQKGDKPAAYSKRDLGSTSNLDLDSDSESEQDVDMAQDREFESEPDVDDFFEGVSLPALNHGYIPGSESESEPEQAEPTVRKNRRGQRARRQIWERKYGDQAKHVKKEEQELALKKQLKEEKKQKALQAKQNYLKQKAELAAKPLHPSWEAKKRQKELQQQTAAFQGKKIVFD